MIESLPMVCSCFVPVGRDTFVLSFMVVLRQQLTYCKYSVLVLQCVVVMRSLCCGARSLSEGEGDKSVKFVQFAYLDHCAKHGNRVASPNTTEHQPIAAVPSALLFDKVCRTGKV